MGEELSHYFYEHLDDAGKVVYRQLLRGLDRMEKQIMIKDETDPDRMQKVLDSLFRENPLIFYVDTSRVEMAGGRSGINLHFQYLYSAKEIKQLRRDLEEQAEVILRNVVQEGMDEYQKTAALHDYMKQNIRYDHSALSVSYFTDSRTVTGAILKKKAVCSGIAKAMQYLLNKAGVKTAYISGRSAVLGNEGPHGWNLVEIAGKIYHLDVTWDLREVNPVFPDSHMFLNLDDEGMFGEHSWELEDYPVCDSLDANYYVVNGLYFRTMRSFELYLGRFLQNRETHMEVRFGDTMDGLDEEGKNIRDRVLGQSRLYGQRNIKITYSYHPKNRIFAAALQYE